MNGAGIENSHSSVLQGPSSLEVIKPILGLADEQSERRSTRLQLVMPISSADIRVAVIDDDEATGLYLTEFLTSKGVNVKSFSSPQDGLNYLLNLKETKKPPFDLIFSDVKMPEMNGIELTKKIVELFPDTPIILITAYAQIEQAVQSIQVGAFDYLEKPLDLQRLEVTMRNALNARQLHLEKIAFHKQELKYDGIFCRSPSMQAIYDLIPKLSKSDSSVLITGESGVGKELIARSIHDNSKRSSSPFISVNCAAIPESLLESELFGHSKGAFTGAHAERKGLFEEANGGTLFLDEIGDLNLNLQVKLLRVLQEKKIRPVGNNQLKEIDVRIITATNKDLNQSIKNQTFREDLYYRLNVIPVHIPPLRQRREDIEILAEYFLADFSKRNDRKISGFTKDAMQKLMHMKFNGNVRELQNVIERSVVLSHDNWIDAQDVPINEDLNEEDILYELTSDISPHSKMPSLRDVETKYIKSVLKRHGGKKLTACKVLGLSRRTLYRKLREFGMEDTSLTGDDTGADARPDSHPDSRPGS